MKGIELRLLEKGTRSQNNGTERTVFQINIWILSLINKYILPVSVLNINFGTYQLVVFVWEK